MSTKLKAIGLGFAAVLAMSAFAVVNATAETGGHFTSNSLTESTVLTGTEEQGTEHHTIFEIPGLTGITCDHVQYDSTVDGNTVEDITVTPTYDPSHCITAGTETTTPVDANECGFTFTIGKKAVGHNTVDIACKGETKYIAITHPNCTIHVPEQAGLEGISYVTSEENGKHSITVEATIENEVTTHFESGICILLGTKKLATFKGSVTVTGFEDEGAHEGAPYGTEGPQVDITATGSEDV